MLAARSLGKKPFLRQPAQSRLNEHKYLLHSIGLNEGETTDVLAKLEDAGIDASLLIHLTHEHLKEAGITNTYNLESNVESVEIKCLLCCLIGHPLISLASGPKLNSFPYALSTQDLSCRQTQWQQRRRRELGLRSGTP